jgi:hypothetical protein
MDKDVVATPGPATQQLGVSRPPLEVDDLPTPEAVFNVPAIGRKELFQFVLGPSLIALGVSIGSGEWLLGPLNVGQYGFVGVGWVITISALLQVFYNIEIARYVMATGEVPVVGFGRVPPGAKFWVPFSLLVIFFANIWGGWARAAAEGLFALINGRIPTPADKNAVVLYAILLMAAVFLLTVLARKITRALEVANFFSIGIQIVVLLIIDLIFVPFSVWWDALRGLVTPALPPEGSDATVIGGLVGFTALASGINWYFMNHYRDKGYGMGSKVGFLSGLRGEGQEVRSNGVTFRETPENEALWRRWMHYLRIDMWLVFFGGAMIGMFLPIILIRQLVLTSGQQPTRANMPTFAANILGQQEGRWLFYVLLFIGFLILFDTQIGIFEALVRNATDAVNSNERMRTAINGDPRRFYYPFMLLLAIVTAVVLQFFQPTDLILISANMANFGALMYPFVMMYLNSKLPSFARPPKYAYVILVLNFLFFGFFFVNFVANQFFGGPLVTF